MKAKYLYSTWSLRKYHNLSSVEAAHHNKEAVQDTIVIEATSMLGFHIRHKYWHLIIGQ